jgi:UDP-glucose 4-epimerase
MKVLITGVAGLIGSNFSEHLLKTIDGIEIVGIDNLSGGYQSNMHENITFYKNDLLEYDEIEKIFKKHTFDYIYHFAAYAAEGLSPFIRRFNYSNNLLATTGLVNLSIKYGVKRFIFTSSMATYGFGNNDGTAFTEETPQKPIDPYGIAKLACEMDIKVAAEQHGLEYCILRPHNVYGKKQNIWDRYRNVLGIWMYQLLNDEDLTIYGSGEQTRAFSYIDDMLEPLWNAAISEKSKNQEINLGGFDELVLFDVAKLLIKIAGKGKLKFLEGRHEVKNAFCSYQKSIDLLDFKMNIKIEEGLTKMWEWAKKQPKKERIKWDKYELDKGIYSFWK